MLHAFAVAATASATAGGDLIAPFAAIERILQVVFVLQQQQQHHKVYPQSLVEYLRSQQLSAAAYSVYNGQHLHAAVAPGAVAAAKTAAAVDAGQVAAGAAAITIATAGVTSEVPLELPFGASISAGLSRELLYLRNDLLRAAGAATNAAAAAADATAISAVRALESRLGPSRDLWRRAANAEAVRIIVDALQEQKNQQHQQAGFSLRQLLSIAFSIVRQSTAPCRSLLFLHIKKQP